MAATRSDLERAFLSAFEQLPGLADFALRIAMIREIVRRHKIAIDCARQPLTTQAVAATPGAGLRKSHRNAWQR